MVLRSAQGHPSGRSGNRRLFRVRRPDPGSDRPVRDGYKPEDWSEEKTKNETDKIKTRTKKTIEEKLGDDPYAKKVFSALLKDAIEKAESMFDYKAQFKLFSDLETMVEDRDVPDLPIDRFEGNKHAQAYYGAFKLVLGEEFAALEAEKGEPGRGRKLPEPRRHRAGCPQKPVAPSVRPDRAG